MKINEIASMPAVTIRTTDALTLAHQMMLWGNMRHLPVVQDGRLVGVISDRDLLAVREGWKLPDKTIAEIMTTDPHTIAPDADVSEASRLFVSEHYDCLPVVERGELLGILTTTDMLRAVEVPARPISANAVGDIMTADPACADAEAPLYDAIGRMLELGIRHLPVVDSAGSVVGMLSDRDVRGYVGDPRAALTGRRAEEMETLTVRDAMTPNPATITADTPLNDAVAWFAGDGLGALPVVDEDGHLVGILSYLDVLWSSRG